MANATLRYQTILKLCKQITKFPKYAILDTAYIKPTINES
jgi:hypothetical protein